MAERQSGKEISNSFYQQHKLKFTILWCLLALFVVGWLLSSGFVVHGNDLPDDYWSSTSVLKDKLLDKAGFLSFLTLMTLVSIALLAWGYWKLHSLPKKHAEHTGQPKLVFWLCMIGFFYNWLWIAAILIVVTDWQVIANVFRENSGLNKVVNNTDSEDK